MELELQYDELKCFSCVLDTVVRREETQEAIVSDALPDIASVVNASGTILLQRCMALDGSVSSDGAVDTAVLFAPEGGGEVCTLPVQVPFHCVTEALGVSASDQVICSADLIGMDVKLMNPRKVMVRVEIALHICAYTANKLQLTTGVLSPEKGLQTKTNRVTHSYIAHTAQRSFPFEEGITIGAGAGKIRRLLHCAANAYCTEAKVSGTKIIVKGGVRVCARYLNEAGEYNASQFDLPVSQVLDGGGCSENAVVMAQLMLKSLEISYYDESSIDLSMELNADCIVLERREVEVLQDVYSTAGPCTVQSGAALLYRLRHCKGQMVSFRQNLDVELSGAEILDQSVVMTDLVTGGELTPKAKLKAALCVRDHAGHILRLEQSCYIDLPAQIEGSRLRGRLIDCVCSSASGTPELRGSLFLREIDDTEGTEQYISAIDLGDKFPESTERRPSAVLCKLQPGETLWDAGKRCCATVRDIMTVNQIKEEAEAQGRFLLIPRHR